MGLDPREQALVVDMVVVMAATVMIGMVGMVGMVGMGMEMALSAIQAVEIEALVGVVVVEQSLSALAILGRIPYRHTLLLVLFRPILLMSFRVRLVLFRILPVHFRVPLVRCRLLQLVPHQLPLDPYRQVPLKVLNRAIRSRVVVELVCLLVRCLRLQPGS